MKTNRQKTYSGYQVPPEQGKGPRQLIATSEKKPKRRAQGVTLASLLEAGFRQTIAKIICKDQILVDIQSAKSASRRSGTDRSRKGSQTVHVKSGAQHILRSSWAQWQQNPSNTFIFQANTQQQQVRSFRTSQYETMKEGILAKTASETSLKQQQHSSRNSSASKQRQPPQSERQSEQHLPHDNKASFGRFLSQKHLQQKEGMFIVQELRESLQSQARDSFKSMPGKENRRENINQVKGLNPSQNNSTQHFLDRIRNGGENMYEGKESEKMVKMECGLGADDEVFGKIEENMSLQRKQSDREAAPHEPHTQYMTKEDGESGPACRFSFASHMRAGLIKPDNQSLDPALSFKIAGDESIENQKNKSQLQVEQLQMSELSSIVSNTKQEMQNFKKDIDIGLDLDAESIKHELAGINLQSNKPKESPQEMVDLNQLAINREEHLDECIHISENTPGKDCQSEYTVHYDVRFLKRKASTTEVTRLSPLRFRKKEDLVGHFVHCRLVGKESTSINVQ